MSDWDFLHEMRDRGYSADDIALAVKLEVARGPGGGLRRGKVGGRGRKDPDRGKNGRQ